ncbi:hypothetical protein TNCT_155771 [Trichonephila clavata]|uniref:Uncharacterized protein n=1 Tax=Trichonephila clavata TaxID=2740835 RepID=A0A8X6G0Q9_TRICU|nr:hypothetical protein TNCT_155771 [Trichonephila clavata]
MSENTPLERSGDYFYDYKEQLACIWACSSSALRVISCHHWTRFGNLCESQSSASNEITAGTLVYLLQMNTIQSFLLVTLLLATTVSPNVTLPLFCRHWKIFMGVRIHRYGLSSRILFLIMSLVSLEVCTCVINVYRSPRLVLVSATIQEGI